MKVKIQMTNYQTKKRICLINNLLLVIVYNKIIKQIKQQLDVLQFKE